MLLVRTLAAALIAALVFFPAATRVSQVLNVGPASGHTCGYHKTVDIPPDPIVVAPAIITLPTEISTPTPKLRRTWRAADNVLPVEPFVSDGGALRAPPCRLA